MRTARHGTHKSGTLGKINNLLGQLAGVYAFLGGLAVFGLMLITVIAVIWRYLLKSPIYGIEDFSILTLTVVAATAVAYGARSGAHVSIDIFTSFLSEGALKVSNAVMRLLVVGMTGFAAYALAVKACGLERACITENLSIEHRPFYYVLASGMAFYCLQTLFELIVGLFTQENTMTKNDEIA